MIIDSSPLAILSAFGVTILIWLCLMRSRRGLPLPPGPKPLPLIGNLLDMPQSHAWLTFAKWRYEYKSDIIYINALGTSMIVINSLDVANDLFEKRSSIYSSRTRLPMLNELMGWSWNFGFQPYGAFWRARRKLFHQEFDFTAAMRFQPQELKASRDLLQRLLDKPEDFLQHLRHYPGSIIMSVAYGIDVLPMHDPFIDTAEKAISGLSEAGMTGAFLVDVLPLLKYVPSFFPGAGFKRKAKGWHQLASDMVEKPFAVVKRKIAEGIARPSFVANCFQRSGDQIWSDISERVIQDTAGAMYTAAADTTASALGTFVLAMLLNPEVQVKAQQELDDVLGHGHLPNFDDEDALPYVSALVKEVLRWQPVTPLAIPHSVETEDEYRGYRIPKDSVVFGNAWAMLHDEQLYPDPHNFSPDRFLKDGQLDPNIKDPAEIAFGFGRRICPGRHMAKSTVWIGIASILAAFTIEKATDEQGHVIEPSVEYSSGLSSYPLPFEGVFRPRSKETESAVRSSIQDD